MSTRPRPHDANDAEGLEWPLLTAAQVAEDILGAIPEKTVLQMAREERLPAMKIGRHVRFSRRAVIAAVKRAAERGQPL